MRLSDGFLSMIYGRAFVVQKATNADELEQVNRYSSNEEKEKLDDFVDTHETPLLEQVHTIAEQYGLVYTYTRDPARIHLDDDDTGRYYYTGQAGFMVVEPGKEPRTTTFIKPAVIAKNGVVTGYQKIYT